MAKKPKLSENEHRLLHDLRGPLVNVRGFAGEINIAVTELTALIDKHGDDLPEDFHTVSAKIFKDDLTPCLEFLGRAIEQMNARIDQFAQSPTESAT